MRKLLLLMLALTILMGNAPFMRKMDVRLPGDINLKTGIFLAVDGQLIAVFAVKYNASENVDYALRMMRRSHITPILAARDPNITPLLLQRKFHKGVRVEYPDITSRVALSEAERDRDLPRALLLREGLLPYAEAVAGSRRLCQAVRRALRIAMFGSVIGALLAFYLVFLGAYDLLTPLALEAFLLLWTLPVLLMADWTGRY
jgi:cation transport ATPase